MPRAVPDHAALHRRGPPDVLDLVGTQRERIQLQLRQRAGRHIGGRQPRHGLRHAMPDHLAQRLRDARHQRFDGGLAELRAAVGAAELQAAALDPAVERQRRRQGDVVGDATTGILRGGLPAAFAKAAVELAEVVEQHLRRARRQRRRREFAEHAVSEPLAWHRAQRFLDAGDGVADVRNARQPDRPDAGEPAHRAAEIERAAGRLGFAAVAFHVDADVVAASKGAQRAREARQQQVVDAGAVGGMGTPQQGVSRGRVQSKACRAGARRFTARTIAWQ
ncbi:hypothetical protein D3C72_1473130 [compost metagenome]